jgi:hypothetical protein
MGLPVTVDDAEARMLRIGGRLIADIGVGTVSALFKTISYPIKPFNDMYAEMELPLS